MKIINFAKKRMIVRLITILVMLTTLCGCHKDEYIENIITQPYGVIITNSTHDEVSVQCKLIAMGMPTLKTGESLEVKFTSSEIVVIDYFGKGTYFKQRSITVKLEKDKVVEVNLVEAP